MPTLRPSVEHVRSLGQFTQMHRWFVEFEKFPACCGGDFKSDDINFRAESMTIPRLNPTTQKIEIRGSGVNQGAKSEYEDTITLTCVETVDNMVTRFMRMWREGCWESGNGGSGRSQDKDQTEATIILTMLTNTDVARWGYKMIGCILDTTDPGGDPGNEADPQKPVLTIKYDYFNENEFGNSAFGFGANFSFDF